MTGLERMRAALNLRLPDRVPFFPLLHYAATRVVGMKIGQFATSADAMAEALLAAHSYYGTDGVHPGVDVVVEAEALGSRTVQPEDAPAFVVEPAIKKEKSDLDKMSIPDPARTGRMAVIVEATRIVSREVGDKALISPWIMGPMNMASQLRGVEHLMFDIVDDPAFFERLLDFTTEVGAAFGGALVEAGAHMICIGEALCSPAFISPRTYRQYVVPRQKRLIDSLRRHGAEFTLLHICADIMPILSDAGSTGASVLDLDWQVNMGEARKVLGETCAVRGNLDPSRTLLQGSVELVKEKCREVLQAKNLRGIILGSGCDVSPDTPKENLLAMAEAIREWGYYG